MFDARLQPALARAFAAPAAALAARGVRSDAVTLGGFAFGVAAAAAAGFRAYALALALLLVNRLADGLDGALARRLGPTRRGAFLDIALDFAFYALMPLGFAFADPARNALPAAALLAAFIGTGSSFLAFAAVAARLSRAGVRFRRALRAHHGDALALGLARLYGGNMKRNLASALTLLLAVSGAKADPAWDATLAKARGETVYWNAWGGDERTNAFIAWVGDQTRARFGVEIKQVKLTDTGEAVARVVAEKAAGRDADGSVDLIWINGANFVSMKQKGLLYGPFVDDLPMSQYIDTANKPSNVVDFTVPTQGYEAPWRLAEFVFIYDAAKVPSPPRSLAALTAWIKAHPGRFAYPDPADFMGASFLKQVLIDLAPDRAALAQPADAASFARETAALWAWLDDVRASLWRRGEQYPANEPALIQALSDGEVDFAMAFDPAEAAAAAKAGRLPETVRVTTFANGSLGNTSFVAIPYNSPHKDAAKVVADFLLDPATQAHAQDIDALGAYNVLDRGKLSTEQRAAFDATAQNPALPKPGDLAPVLDEPHPSWMTGIAQEWRRRYAR